MTPKERAAMQQALEALESCEEKDWSMTFDSNLVPEAITALREALEQPVSSNTELDAKRYAYTTHRDFFQVCDSDSTHQRFRVGLQPEVESGFPKPINQCVTGFGETLEEAIDMAINAASQPVSQEPVAKVTVRPFNPMDASYPTVEVKWLKEPVSGVLYAAPQPVKEVELTDDEISTIWYDSSYGDSGIDFARAVIAAHKEKQRD